MNRTQVGCGVGVGVGGSIIKIIWSLELNDLWSKTICRPNMVVRSGATFILRWSCFDNSYLTLISLLRIIPSNRAENRLTEMTAAVSSELIFLKHTQCGHSMWPTKTDVPLKGQKKSKSESECSSRECSKYMHKGCWSTRLHFIELDLRHIFEYGDPAIINLCKT